MALSAEDQALVADMQQRELHLKRRQRASDRVHYELKRFQGVVVAGTAMTVVLVEVGLLMMVVQTLPQRPAWWAVLIACVVVGAILGTMAGRYLLGLPWGRRLIARKEGELRRKYSGDLHTGRRWLRFYYEDEDIAPYIPQVLSFIDAGRYDTVAAALDHAKATGRGTGGLFEERAQALFAHVADQSTSLVLSSVADDGHLSSRIMRFVKTDVPGVWHITTAPEATRFEEFDRAQFAIVTSPTPDGGTISSNRVRVTRPGVPFSAIAHLYEAQVPGFTEGMTDEARERELVYELTLLSARVDTWTDHAIVTFPAAKQ